MADYFEMLDKELRGIKYNKSEHRRALLRLLPGRSHTAVERKHMNISAVLRDIRQPFIDGYKPLPNYQHLLFDVVLERVESSHSLLKLVEQISKDPVTTVAGIDLGAIWQKAPDFDSASFVAENPPVYYANPTTRKTDYLELEAKNQSLGLAGEELVMDLEFERLHAADRKDLATRIEHVASEQDGLGYDILSYETDGSQRLIEVKTTSYGKRTPFYVTRNELACSVEFDSQYRLYRVFDYRSTPRLFSLSGRLDRAAFLEPTVYRAKL